MHTNEPEIYNYLDALPLPIALALRERTVYRRFLSAQVQMERLAADCWTQMGTLNSPAVLAQEAVAAGLSRRGQTSGSTLPDWIMTCIMF